MWRIRTFSWMFLGAFLAIPVAKSSEIIEDFYTDRSLSSFSESNARFTEHVDPFTGNLFAEFQSIRIPGEGGLDIVVRHFYANHQNDGGVSPLMSVGGVGWNFHFGRIITNRDDLCISNLDRPEQYPVIETSDGMRQILYPATEDGFDYITVNRWKVDCLAAGGFAVYAPDGVRYTMNQKNSVGAVFKVHSWYTTSIQDRNGNELNFQYVGGSSTFRLSKIESSDSRIVGFNYTGDQCCIRLSSITAHNRTWNFHYGEFSNARGRYYLKEITPPTGEGRWIFGYMDSSNSATEGNYSLSKVVTSDGGMIEYTYGLVQFDPSAYPRTTVVITRKTNDLEGNTGLWRYAYEPAGDGHSTPSCDSSLYDVTTVSTPTGTERYLHYGVGVAATGCIWRVGLLKEKQVGPYREQYSWDKQKISYRPNGRPQRPAKQDGNTYAPILTRKTITLDGTNYTTDYSNHDSYGNPRRMEESGNGSRSTTLSYYINTNKWIINQVEDESISGIGTIDRTYSAATGNLISVSKYGLLTEYSYYANGNISSITNGRGKTTAYSRYYRGVPRREERPEGVVIERAVDLYGNILSEADGRGNVTGYSYDYIDRLIKIDYPEYADRNISWSIRKKTETMGGYSRITNFDGFGREIGVTESGAVPSVSISTRYNSVGEVVFRSYRGSNGGDSFQRDQIGRVTKITRADGAYRTFEHLSGNKVKVTNERGNATTFTYLSFGDPLEERYLAHIAAPEGMETSIGRNNIGQMTSVTQYGRTRIYSYFDNRTLKSITDPETGITAFERDGVGNMTSRKVGRSSKTTFIYDGLDRLSYIDYPSGTPDVDFSHDNEI